MPVNLSRLRIGDVIRQSGSDLRYVVLTTAEGHASVIAAHAITIMEPGDWELVSSMPAAVGQIRVEAYGTVTNP